MILELQRALKEDGVIVSLVKLCNWFGVPRRTVYYKPTKGDPKVQAQFVEPIKAMIEENPAFGYRTVAHLLDMNKNTVQRVFQIMGWQVRKRPVGFRPRIQALPSVASALNERWSTDMCRVWCGRDNWATLALVIDCHTRELLGWHLSRSGRSKTAESALEQALIARYGHLGRVQSRSYFDRTTGWSSPAEATPPWSKAMGCSKSSSPPTPRSKTAWSSG